MTPAEEEAFRQEVYLPLEAVFRREFGAGTPEIGHFLGIQNVARYLVDLIPGMETMDPSAVTLPARHLWPQIRRNVEFMIIDEAERLKEQGQMSPRRLEVVALEDLTELSRTDLQEVFDAVQRVEKPAILSADGSRTMLFWGTPQQFSIAVDSNWAPLEEIASLLGSMGIAVQPKELERIVPRNFDGRPGIYFTQTMYERPSTPSELIQQMKHVERLFEKLDARKWEQFVEEARKLRST